MNKSVIVHGPQGCGKSQNSRVLMQHFGCTRVIDSISLDSPAWLKKKATETPTLFLTNQPPEWADGSPIATRHATVISYDDAIAAAGAANAASSP